MSTQTREKNRPRTETSQNCSCLFPCLGDPRNFPRCSHYAQLNQRQLWPRERCRCSSQPLSKQLIMQHQRLGSCVYNLILCGHYHPGGMIRSSVWKALSRDCLPPPDPSTNFSCDLCFVGLFLCCVALDQSQSILRMLNFLRTWLILLISIKSRHPYFPVTRGAWNFFSRGSQSSKSLEVRAENPTV